MSHSRSSRSDDAVYITADPPAPMFGDRGSRITEEAGAEEMYHADGSLRWRRILRRRTTDLPPAAPPQARARVASSTPAGLGILGSSMVAQITFWVHLGAAMLGHEQLGPGRGGVIGYLIGSALATIIIWRIGRR